MDQVPTRSEVAARMVQTLPGWGRWARDLRDFATPYGKIGYRQASILFVIRHRLVPPSQRTPTNLARFFGVQNSAVSRAVEKLEAGGFLVRQVAAGDQRTHLLALTDRGINASIWIEAALVEPIEQALIHLTPEQIASLHDHLDILYGVLNQLLTLPGGEH